MLNALAIARREFSSYFNSPIAYIFLGVFLAFSGVYLFFLSGFFIQKIASMRAYFGVAPWIFMFLAPAVTMRLIAEERKSRTIEVLMTLPVRDTEVVLGKFLGAIGLVSVGLVFTFAYPISISMLLPEGYTFDWGPVVGGYLGIFFLASAFIAIGMWTSAMTKEQVVGFILGLLICFFFVIIDKAAFLFPESIAGVVQYLSAAYHFESIARGVIDSRDLVYFLTLTACGLALCTRSLSRARQ